MCLKEDCWFSIDPYLLHCDQWTDAKKKTSKQEFVGTKKENTGYKYIYIKIKLIGKMPLIYFIYCFRRPSDELSIVYHTKM